MTLSAEVLLHDTLLVVGAGPVGLVLATTLARQGVRTVILEKNRTTTRWPKMDLTTARSCEIFRTLGLCEGLRRRGVASGQSFNCLFSTGLHAKEAISSWPLPSVDEFQAQILANNDGSMPLEPWQRISQDHFEAWLKEKCLQNPMIDFRAGCEVIDAHEQEHGAAVTFIDTATGEERSIKAAFAIACDGAHSTVRKSLGIKLSGGPISAQALLIHFRSKDLTRLRKQGQFWHIFFPNEAAAGGSVKGAIIAQDEIDVWTVHCFLPADFPDQQLSSEDAVYSVLGGIGEPFVVKIDENLVRSVWTPSIALADKYISPKGRIVLAGDACHQMVPTGGYGMNTGLSDAFDLGWKLAAIVKGWGGPLLLQSYEADRRPIGVLSLHWSKIHMSKLMALSETVGLDGSVIFSDSKAGAEMRNALHDYVQTNDAHNKSFGVEMGYRYESSICVSSPLDSQVPAPEFDPLKYTPTTFPGCRAPHVFLNDGSPIFDRFGIRFTLVSFLPEVDIVAETFRAAAHSLEIPISIVDLHHEDHARKIWKADIVLVRPDGFVSWHNDSTNISLNEAKNILKRAAGFEQL